MFTYGVRLDPSCIFRTNEFHLKTSLNKSLLKESDGNALNASILAETVWEWDSGYWGAGVA
jgi:hypothetical protein